MIPVLTLLAAALWDRPFTVDRPAEVTATVAARCGGCSWASPTKTAAVLILQGYRRYPQHLPVRRGEGPTQHTLSLWLLAAGRHLLGIPLDRGRTPQARRESFQPRCAPA